MFIELLIVLGVMGILSAIVIVAINPKKNLCEVANGKRHITTRELTNAVNEYEIRTFQKAGGDVPVGEANAKPICRQSITNPSCINLDVLVPDYIIAIPQDTAETGTLLSGYSMYRFPAGMDTVISTHIEACQ